MGVTLLHDSFKLPYTEALVSQVFSAHSLKPGAAKPAPDLKSACKTSTWWDSLQCAFATGANSEMLRRTSNPPAGQGRLKALSVKGWAGLIGGPGSLHGEGRGQNSDTAWGATGPGTSPGHCFHRPRGGCRPRVTHRAAGDTRHRAVTCKTTQWPNIPWLYTRRSAEEVEY